MAEPPPKVSHAGHVTSFDRLRFLAVPGGRYFFRAPHIFRGAPRLLVSEWQFYG